MKNFPGNAMARSKDRHSQYRRIRARFVSAGCAAAIAAAAIFPNSAQAQTSERRGPFVRDAEIEALIRDYAKPIFKVAGLSSQGIKIHLINDTNFNAFVVDGQNMFIHIGALMKSDTPNQLIGVIAHETGHIAGGHLARLRNQMSKARSGMLMLQALAIAAIAAGAVVDTGSNDLSEIGAAVLYGGQSLVQRSILAYRRAEESAADQAAVSYLNATRQSIRGMLKTFELFASQILTSSNVNPYLQSHPIPRQRIAQLRELARSSAYYDNKDSPELQLRHDMARAKLFGFIELPSTVFNRYRNDTSLPARYARAIAQHHNGNLSKAISGLDYLIAKQPNNPYLLETKGQFLHEKGKSKEALAPLRKAVALNPRAGLIRILLAQALLNAGNKKDVDEAIGHLKKAISRDRTYPSGYRFLADAYYRKGRDAEAKLATAHRYLYLGLIPDAKKQASWAKKGLPRGSVGWVQADDILVFQPPRR